MCKNRHGAAAARGAHNSEVTGSKPVAGIPFCGLKKMNYILLHFWFFKKSRPGAQAGGVSQKIQKVLHR
jgi:hypothetical protein